MTDQADRLQAVAKARWEAGSELLWTADYPSGQVRQSWLDSAREDCAVYDCLSDADAAWREKQDGGECPECKNYIGHCPACHRDLPTKLPSECPYCGGSGHREDAEEYIRRTGPPAQEMPATQPPSAPEGDVERLAVLLRKEYNSSDYPDIGTLWQRIARVALAFSPAPQPVAEDDVERLEEILAEIASFLPGADMQDIADLAREGLKIVGKLSPAPQQARSEDEVARLRLRIEQDFGPRYRIYCNYCHGNERTCRATAPGYCALADYESALAAKR